jgi:LPXTG-motif cell wall-anchored protein
MEKKDTGNLGRIVAWGSAAILVTASVAFAAPSYAATHSADHSHSAQGHAHHQAEKQKQPAATQTRGYNASQAEPAHQGASAVSLPRPNDFQAQADPDGMANGGVDQFGGQGGVDTSSQDGNNGSGNDADCEDDNNGVGIPGHCKDRPGHETPPAGEDTPPQTGTDNPGTDVPAPGGDVAGPMLQPMLQPAPATVAGSAVQVAAPGVFAATAAPAQAAAAPTAGVLPNTGAGQALLALAIAGLAGLAVGAAMLRQGRRAKPVAG